MLYLYEEKEEATMREDVGRGQLIAQVRKKGGAMAARLAKAEREETRKQDGLF